MKKFRNYFWIACCFAVLGLVAGSFGAKPLLAQVRAALVSDVDNPARGAVQLRFQAVPYQGGSTSFYYDPQYVVAAGKRLVVDTLSVMSLFTNGTQPVGGFMLLEGADASACFASPSHFPVAFANSVVIMPLAFQGSGINGNVFGAISRTQAYVDPGHCLAVRIDHNLIVDPSVTYQITLSGHLVSLP